jgi:glycosyltransferase involved in cell wall biosynthesis
MLSFIVPVQNETDSLERVYTSIREQAEALNAKWEVIFIDHGQCELTWLYIQRVVRKDPRRVRASIFFESADRSAALTLGYREAHGELIFTIEPDLLDDPSQITGFLQRIDWRVDDEPVVAPTPARARGELESWRRILPRGIFRGSNLPAAMAS